MASPLHDMAVAHPTIGGGREVRADDASGRVRAQQEAGVREVRQAQVGGEAGGAGRLAAPFQPSVASSDDVHPPIVSSARRKTCDS